MKKQTWSKLSISLETKVLKVFNSFPYPFDPALCEVNITGFPRRNASAAADIEELLIKQLGELSDES